MCQFILLVVGESEITIGEHSNRQSGSSVLFGFGFGSGSVTVQFGFGSGSVAVLFSIKYIYN